jgi:hypothetical protein
MCEHWSEMSSVKEEVLYKVQPQGRAEKSLVESSP